MPPFYFFLLSQHSVKLEVFTCSIKSFRTFQQFVKFITPSLLIGSASNSRQLRQERFRSWMLMSYNPCRNYQGYHLYPRPQSPSEAKEIIDKFQLFFLLRFSRPTTWPAQQWIFYYEVGIYISKREQVLKQKFSRTRAEQYNNDNDISCTRARKLPNRRKVQSLNGRE